MGGSVKHTPGPWGFSFESVDPEWAVVTTTGGSVIANVNADHRQEANARLIAAAPDLLAAAKLLPTHWLREGILSDPRSDGLRIKLEIVGTTYEAEILISELRAAAVALSQAEEPR